MTKADLQIPASPQAETVPLSGPVQVVVLLATLLPRDSTLCGCIGAEKEGE